MGSMNGERDGSPGVLRACLEVAVPMWAARAAEWTAAERAREAERAGDIIAAGTDVLFRDDPTFRKSEVGRLPTAADLTKEQADSGVMARSYRPAEIFNAAAEAIGIGSLAPGGIMFLGRVWCRAHPRERVPGTSGLCAACQAAERAA